MRIQIIEEAKRTGESIEVVADRYAMCPLFTPDDNGTFEYDGKRITIDEFKQRFPHRRFVLIMTAKTRNKIYGENTNK